ncbi:hypothetical protein [Daejeonella sp.]|uniref:hypothetical protein n=1 Tax=Daejeonella sp. TaxID=2805397 RepID=UPI00271E673C|nr:hypothetical protein [Daejeonella sp.]MDO8992065.1 hypothetical protein [Daejeonella sp.]MDP2413080.1 hypothetical protein [Daejeonella sp.]
MDRDKLFNRLSKTLSKADAVKIALDQACMPADLISLSLYPQNEIAFRASWVLEQFLYFRWADLVPYLPDFITSYLIQKNRSCQRHYTKIMMYLTDSTSVTETHSLITEYQEQVIEITFDWLIDPRTPVAVKVNCMDILLQFGKKQAWITDELRSQVQFLLKNGSAAVQSRGKRILKKLKS